jgi:hypothetical protein
MTEMESILQQPAIEGSTQQVTLKAPNQCRARQTDYKKVLQNAFNTDMLEFTLAVGCPVQCKRYCPQEVFLQKYGNNPRMLSFNAFKQILYDVPTNVTLNFAGFCEPFVNPDFSRMAEYAYNKGYNLQVATTLYGAKSSDIDRLLDLEYQVFCIHMRDGKVVNFQLTPEYQDNFFRVIEGVPNVVFTIMNGLFSSNNRENVTRGVLPKPKAVGFCQKLITPQFVVLPNGDAFLCCQDFGLKHKMGNLFTEAYAEIKQRFIQNKNHYYQLCSYCSFNKPYSEVLYSKVVSRGKNVMRGIATGRLLKR